ncbi:exopolysaccharide biosynthesis protein [Roseomonas sp. E05]|uniref:exopolysaccharide biosynthesis protein n=1 Tax=Roseomonas sp. E05 TaxID=3046310 RepID=UPI0024BAC520|nr:exopolysaccharide biosynthesis protein [Roseomonas sp. E05]MDJ0389384.1 exopolysaccharide biosynthesis protein [Roseomonas sp. E05]
MVAWPGREAPPDTRQPRSRLSRDLIARTFEGTMRRRRTRPRPPPSRLKDILTCVEEACGEAETVSCRAILDQIGQRSFGAVLLLPALVVVSPLSGIIGLPTGAATLIVLICGQMLLGRKEAWVPRAVTTRSMRCQRVQKAVRFLRPFSRLTDRILRARLRGVTEGAGTRCIALACILLALMMPPLELVPFATSLIAAVITLFGLALVANDGLMALIAYALTAAALAGAGSVILG